MPKPRKPKAVLEHVLEEAYWIDYDDLSFVDGEDTECGIPQEFTPPPSTLDFNLFQLSTKKESSKDSPLIKKKPSKPAPSPSTREDDEPSDHFSSTNTTKPILTKSKSWAHLVTSSGSLQTSLSRTRSGTIHSFQPWKTCTHMTDRKKTALARTKCIQSLLPPGVRASVLGPVPRASWTIVSTQYRAAAALIWSLQSELAVVPLIGCGSLKQGLQVAGQMESTIRDLPLPDGTWSTYWNLCQMVATRKTEWVLLFEEALDDVKPPDTKDHFKILTKAGEKEGVRFGESNDDFDLFLQLDQTYPETEPSTLASSEVPSHDHGDDARCLVCFDTEDYDMAMLQLLPCGHNVCSRCLRRYLQSAAGSGLGTVRCVAHQCNSRLDLYDSAQLLHTTFDSVNDAETFHRLTRFQVERTGTRLLMERGSTRFCPSPSCHRVMVTSPEGKDESASCGSSLLQCACGVSLCAACDGPSHVGTSCERFQKLHQMVQSGKLDGELASMTWLLRNSQPCPKCRYPIQRDGGCNHVRCQQCDCYFCWQCGGPGTECMAFLCKKTGKYWHKDPAYNSNRTDRLASRVEGLRNYRMTDRRLESLKCELANEGKQDEYKQKMSLLDLQVNQVLLWLYTYRAVDVLDKSLRSIESHCEPVQNLELLLLALSIRKTMHSHRAMFAREKDGFSLEELARATGCNEKGISKRKLQAKRDRDASNPKKSSIETGLADGFLQVLCTISHSQFSKEVSKAIQNGMHLLTNRKKLSASQTSGPGRGSSKRKKRPPIVAINKKGARSRAPWKKGMKPVSNNEGDQFLDTRQSRRKWKNRKARASSRRALAVDQSILTS